jgi:hypothetical protein
MSIGDQFKKIAGSIAIEFEGRISRLQAELTEIETRKAEIETQLRAVSLGPERVFNFQPQIGGKFQCPRCWVERGLKSPVNPIPSKNPREDLFRCHTCHYDLIVSH